MRKSKRSWRLCWSSWRLWLVNRRDGDRFKHQKL